MQSALFRLGAAVAVMQLAACAGSPIFHAPHERLGWVRVDACDVPGCDYRVVVRNEVDIGWDGDRPDHRVLAAKGVLGESCPQPELIRETVLERGTYPLSMRPRKDFTLLLRCPKGA